MDHRLVGPIDVSCVNCDTAWLTRARDERFVNAGAIQFDAVQVGSEMAVGRARKVNPAALFIDAVEGRLTTSYKMRSSGTLVKMDDEDKRSYRLASIPR